MKLPKIYYLNGIQLPLFSDCCFLPCLPPPRPFICKQKLTYMKKYLSLLIIATSCFCISCNMKSENGPSATAQKNLDAMHGVTKCFDSKDFSKLGDYIADDAVDHAGENGDIKGLANLKADFQKWVDGVDKGKSEVVKELADDEYVMSWMRYTGTYKIPMMGHKAGESYDMKALEIAKFKDGKAIEHWTLMEPAEMMKMMPQSQMPMQATPTDTTKKSA